MTTEKKQKPKRVSAKEKEQKEFLLKLREHVLSNNVRVLHTNIRHVSRSGMQRKIDVVSLRPSGDPSEPVSKSWLSYWAAKALGWRFCPKYDAVVVDGCGMDMGFHLVYTLSYLIFKDVPREKWPADLPLRNSEVENEPGYVLQQKWI
jgi:hypothetical protein